MAQSLGSLFVELKAETGGFVNALSKAAYTAQQGSKQMSRDFSDLGRIASQTFSGFGDFSPAISKLSLALETAGRAASSAMKTLATSAGGAGTAVAAVGGLAVGAAVGIGTLAAGALALAAHAAASAKKMEELAQSAGVSVETFSGLSYAAKAAGVDVETLATGMERLSKSAFAAAHAPEGATNAYTRLHIALRDSSGSIRPTSDLMLDLADRFSRMPDGIEKTADALQILGRGGAALIPFFNLGKAAIADLKNYAQATGAVLSGPAAEAATKFELNLTKIGIATDGAKNRLMVDLLPSLQTITAALVRVGSDGQPLIGKLVDSLAGLTKGVLETGAAFFEFAEQLGGVILSVAEFGGAVLYAIGADMQAASQAIRFDFSGAKRSMSEGSAMLEGVVKDFIERGKTSWKSYSDFVDGLNATPGAGKLQIGDPTGWMLRNMPAPRSPGGGSTGASGRTDTVAELVKNLRDQAAAELAVASATDKSTAGTLLANAAREAEVKISETRNRLQEEAKALEAQLADARKEAASDETGNAGERAVKLQHEISAIRAMLAELQKDTPQITSLYAEIASAGFGAKAAKDLEEATVKTDEETAALLRLGAAYREGPGAIEGATIANKLAPFQKQLTDLEALMTHLQKIGAPTGPVGSTSLIGSLFGNLQEAHDELAAGIDRYSAALNKVDTAEVGKKIGEEMLAVKGDAAAYSELSKAALASAEARREAAARAAEQKFIVETPGATSAQARDVYANALGSKTLEYQQTVLATAAQLNLNQAYADEMTLLADARKIIADAGESTIAIDNKIYETRTSHLLDYRAQVFDAQNAELLGNEKIYEQGIQLTEQWDKAALSVGTIGEKFRAMADQIEIDGQNLGGKIVETFKKGFDDIAGSMAKMIVTGKANFRSLFEGIAEEMLKAQIQSGFSKIFTGLFGGPGKGAPGQQAGPGGTPGILKGSLGLGGAVAGAFGVKLPGGPGGGANGSAGSPFYVIIADSSGNPFGVGNSLPITAQGSSNATSAFSAWGDLTGASKGAKGGASGGGGSSVSGITADLSKTFDSIGSSLSKTLSTLMGSLSGILKGVGGLFGGFLAGGGDASSDRAYVVGENGPEIFMPGQAGRVIPSLRGFRAAGGDVLRNSAYMVGENGPEVFMPDSAPSASSSRGGGGGDTYHLHVHGVQDADSFNKSKGQIFADLQQQIALAHYRNRGGF